MNNFNNLYNNILTNIISQNKASREALFNKNNVKNKQYILSYLDGLNNNKLADLLAKFFVSGELTNTSDNRIEHVTDILERKTNIDIQQVTSLNQFLASNQDIIDKSLNIDSLPELSQKKEFGDGIVIYKVQDNKKGMKAVRRIVDAQWGKKANPWCLISRSGGNLDAWHYWQRYNAYPKHIAFQDGKLLAFCANVNKRILWWDRYNQLSHKLKDLNGNEVQTEEYESYPFEQRYHLTFNKRTKRYDAQNTIRINNDDLVDGHFPVKFGYIKGKFLCSHCDDLKSLQGAPQYIEGNFVCGKCDSLTSLVGGPAVISGDYNCNECANLTSLQGAPKNVWGLFDCDGCKSLTSLIGGPRMVQREFDCSSCTSLTTLEGAPQSCQYFVLNSMHSLTSLVGSPKNVDFYWISSCDKLSSLEGISQKINKSFEINWCDNLTSLKGGPIEVGGEVSINHCHNLVSVEDKPKVINGQFKVYDCEKVKQD